VTAGAVAAAAEQSHEDLVSVTVDPIAGDADAAAAP
jgi:hypothetical protein